MPPSSPSSCSLHRPTPRRPRRDRDGIDVPLPQTSVDPSRMHSSCDSDSDHDSEGRRGRAAHKCASASARSACARSACARAQSNREFVTPFQESLKHNLNCINCLKNYYTRGRRGGRKIIRKCDPRTVATGEDGGSESDSAVSVEVAIGNSNGKGRRRRRRRRKAISEGSRYATRS